MIHRSMFLIASLVFCGFQPDLFSMVRAGVEVDHDDDEYCYYHDCGWNGPGFYYGIWFDNEWEYNDWHRGHYYYRDGGHRHGGGHHGGEHHGGGHHGGGHGGHH